jgi:hypothetical protein
MNIMMIAFAILAVVAAITVVSTEQIQAKKHTQCFKSGEIDGSSHNAFDAAQFRSCGKNYQDGYVQDCTSAGRDKPTCEADEDTQIDDNQLLFLQKCGLMPIINIRDDVNKIL